MMDELDNFNKDLLKLINKHLKKFDTNKHAIAFSSALAESSAVLINQLYKISSEDKKYIWDSYYESGLLLFGEHT